MPQYLIYGLVDPTTNQLKYIGKSCYGLRRPMGHTTEGYLKREKTYKANWIRSLLQQALKPRIIILQEFQDPDILNEAEIFWIRYFKEMGCKLTNATNGGGGSLGSKRFFSIETRRKMSLAKKGMTWPIEIVKKRADSNKGKPRYASSEEIRKAWAIKNGAKQIIDQYGNVYESSKFAARKLNLYTANIRKVLKGQRHHTGGYKFKYLEDSTCH